MANVEPAFDRPDSRLTRVTTGTPDMLTPLLLAIANSSGSDSAYEAVTVARSSSLTWACFTSCSWAA